MSVPLSLTESHRIVLSNTLYYEKPTEPLYLDRTLRFHDFIYLITSIMRIDFTGFPSLPGYTRLASPAGVKPSLSVSCRGIGQVVRVLQRVKN